MLPRLSVRWQPAVRSTTLRIDYRWPGAGPQALEQQVTAPLEAGMALVRDVEQIKSVSRQGGGYIEVTVSEQADGDFVRFNVASQVRRLYPSLPAEVAYPTITYAAFGEEETDLYPVLTYALSGPDDPATLYRYATDRLAPALSLVPGLNRTEITGGNQLHWQLRLDARQLAVAGLDRQAIERQLAEHFSRQGLGFLRVGEEKLYTLRADAVDPRQLDLQDWYELPILRPVTADTSQTKQRPVRQYTLRDFGEIQRLPLPPTAFHRVNGQNSIRLLAYPTRAANQLDLAADFRQRVAALRTDLPTGYQLRLEDDATERLREELAKTRTRTALSIGILLIFVLLAYRSWRRLSIILLGLIINLGLAFLLYFLFRVELNLYAFAGIAVSFGIMIDNIIIVLDAKVKKGGAAGTGDVRPAIFGATLTTVASLSVIWFLSEELRYQLYELARVMVINLATSVVVALALVPGLIGSKSSPKAGDADRPAADPMHSARGSTPLHERLIRFLLRYRKTCILLVVLAFGLPVFWLPHRVADWPLYNRTLGSDYYQEMLRPHVNRWLGGSFRLFSYYVYEGSGFRRPEETRLYVQAALREGATLEQLNQVLLQMEGYLAEFSGQVDRYTTRVYSGQYGQININFPSDGSTGFPYLLKSQLTAYATNYGGVEWNIYGVGQSYSNTSGGQPVSFNVILKGYNQAGLDEQSNRLAELLLQHPRVQEVNTDANLNWWERERYEYVLDYDHQRLAARGLSPPILQGALQWYDRNEQPTLYLSGGEPVAIIAQNATDYDRWRLENWSLPVAEGQLAFREVGSVVRRPAPQALHKEDQQYLRLVAFEYLGSPRFGSKHLSACLDTLRAELPLGFTAERRAGYQFAEEGKEWSGLMGLAVVLIFFICALLFESLRQAFNIVLLIPISFIGIFLTFYLFELRLDQGGYTSFLLVTGLVVNGLILIINEFNFLRKRFPGWAGSRVYAVAFRRKITPVFLTVVSTSVGLLPFLFVGKQEVFWPGLAAGTIGGLVFSLVVMAVVSPIFYLRE